MFISCSWISLYTSTILISAKPATNGPWSDPPIVLAGFLSWDRTARTFALNYSDAVGDADTLIQRVAARPRDGRRKWRTGVNAGVSAVDSLKQRVTMPVRPQVTFLPKARECSPRGNKCSRVELNRESFRGERNFSRGNVSRHYLRASHSLFLSDLRSTQKDFTLLLNELADFTLAWTWTKLTKWRNKRKVNYFSWRVSS